MVQERFTVTYQLACSAAEAPEWAERIALEQTVELPRHLAPQGWIRDEVIGRLERCRALSERATEVQISFPVEATAFELTQLLNVVFGNSSLNAGIRVADIALSPQLQQTFQGPRFGLTGLRERLGVESKPLLMSALKPMGLNAEQLAKLAYDFALGGVDIIKDDHGLSDQPWAPYEERLKRCVEAVNQANAQTGGKSCYAPNVTAAPGEMTQRALAAKELGAGAVLISPGLCGFEGMRALSRNVDFGLPIVSHPALLGGFVTHPQNGMTHGLLFGKLQRVAGADSSIFPNYGGRFGFSREECLEIATSCLQADDTLAAMLPTPGGGMTAERVVDMREAYGDDVMYLVGGGLYGMSPDLVANVRHFLNLIGRG